MTAPENAVHGVRHLIDDVQRFGLLSAATVVDRYSAIVDRAMAGHPVDPAQTASGEHDVDGLVDGAARIAAGSLRLLETAASMLDGLGQRPAAGGMAPLDLDPALPGSTSQVSLWVHNPTAHARTAVRLHVTSLVSSSGLVLPAGTVSIHPESVPLLEAGASQEVHLRVDVPAEQPPGGYHGLVLSSAVPSEPIALRLQVTAPAGNSP